jgi:hypothetical protein
MSSNIDLYLQLIDTDLTQVWTNWSVRFDEAIFRSNDFKKRRQSTDGTVVFRRLAQFFD